MCRYTRNISKPTKNLVNGQYIAFRIHSLKFREGGKRVCNLWAALHLQFRQIPFRNNILRSCQSQIQKIRKPKTSAQDLGNCLCKSATQQRHGQASVRGNQSQPLALAVKVVSQNRKNVRVTRLQHPSHLYKYHMIHDPGTIQSPPHGFGQVSTVPI